MIHCCYDDTFFIHFSYDNLPDHYKYDNKFFFTYMNTSVIQFFEILHPKISKSGWNKSFSMILNLSLGLSFVVTLNSNIFGKYWTNSLVLIEIFDWLFIEFFEKNRFLWYYHNHLKTLLYCKNIPTTIFSSFTVALLC